MILLQIPGTDGAAQTILEIWGAPGAIILFGIFSIAIIARWLGKRETKRFEYDQIRQDKEEKRVEALQIKNDSHFETIVKSNEKLTNVIENNSLALNNNSEIFKMIFKEKL